MKKAVIYGRISTDKQDYQRQVNELNEYAIKNDYEVIETFTDIQSGKTKAKDRKAASAMFDYIKINNVDIVLVSELSRLGRSAIDVQNNIHRLVNELKVNLYIKQQCMKAYTADDKRKLNSTFKLITDVLANVAQMEREQISDRVKSGLEEARRKGKKLGRPTGSIKSNKKILKEYKSVVKELNSGLSLRKVAKLCDVSVNTVRKVQAAMIVIEQNS